MAVHYHTLNDREMLDQVFGQYRQDGYVSCVFRLVALCHKLGIPIVVVDCHPTKTYLVPIWAIGVLENHVGYSPVELVRKLRAVRDDAELQAYYETLHRLTW